MKHKPSPVLAGLIALVALFASPNAVADSRIEQSSIRSTNFAGNKIGVSSTRKYEVYLPDGYAQSDKRYPVIYFLHTFFENETAFFGNHNGNALLDKAIANGDIGEVIVVTADFSTQVGSSIYANSPVTGNWRDFMVEELVPHIDATYRTLAKRESRGIVGFQLGGYGAIRFAARHPDIFGSVYALHPVATGFGHTLMQSRPDWKKLETLISYDELEGDFLSQIFLSIYQATLPNPDKPPLYVDAPATVVDGELVLDAALTDKLQKNFFLERQVGDYAENMKSLIGFKFDWGRHDGNQDHVYSNQFYSRKLNEYGVPHEAEEYNGGWGDKTFDDGGRMQTDVIPFFNTHLTFEKRS